MTRISDFVPSLDEAAIMDALTELQQRSIVVPHRLMVTNEGIDLMATRLAAGEISVERLRNAGIEDGLIEEVVRRAVHD